MTSAWQAGWIDPWWQQKHRDLSYIHEPFNNSQDLEVWRALGFTQARFTGDMYDMRHPEPQWIDPFRQNFDMQHFSWSVYRMRPGDCIPEHGDTYQKFCEIHGVADINKIQRVVVFLEDWQSGHYFEIDRTPVANWSAGDWVSWLGNTPHLAANMGSQDRYTLQLTGLVNSTVRATA